jgi:hypothetical protein
MADMSGGSYEYLCFKDASELLSASHDEPLQRMTDRLAALGYAPDAAAETQAVLYQLRQSRTRIQTHIDRMRGIWRAVEWWDSSDSGEDGVVKALAEYRGEA